MVSVIIHRDIPLIKTMENFLTHEECQVLIEESRNRLRDSSIISYSGYGVLEKGIRSTWSATANSDNLFVKNIRDRISILLDIDVERFDNLEVICYKEGGEFKLHRDDFNCIRLPQACEKGGNRIASVIIYLNDNFDGGFTDFPYLKFRVQPKEGKFLFFDYSNSDQEIKHSTSHSAEPVYNGEKWIAALWIREYSRTVSKPS